MAVAQSVATWPTNRSSSPGSMVAGRPAGRWLVVGSAAGTVDGGHGVLLSFAGDWRRPGHCPCPRPAGTLHPPCKVSPPRPAPAPGGFAHRVAHTARPQSTGPAERLRTGLRIPQPSAQTPRPGRAFAHGVAHGATRARKRSVVGAGRAGGGRGGAGRVGRSRYRAAHVVSAAARSPAAAASVASRWSATGASGRRRRRRRHRRSSARPPTPPAGRARRAATRPRSTAGDRRHGRRTLAAAMAITSRAATSCRRLPRSAAMRTTSAASACARSCSPHSSANRARSRPARS